MISFFRLLENSGLGYFEYLIENMSRSQATQIFDFHGVHDAANLGPDELKGAWRNLLKGFHQPGSTEGYSNPEAVKELNAAYDVLKNAGPAGRGQHSATGTRYDPNAPRGKQDYRNADFIQRKMAELSGAQGRKWTLWAWDGYFFRHSLTVMGCPEIFHEMAEAMVVFNSQGGNPYDTVAILASQGDSRVLRVLYYQGEFLDAAPELPEHESFNLNPSNDQSFCNRLNRELQRILIRSHSQGDQPVSEAVLMEVSSRTPTTVIYHYGEEGWRPLGVLNQGDDLNTYLRDAVGFILSSAQQKALYGGENVMNLAIRTFEAILPQPGW
jgi:hypothetical protein